MPGLPKYHVIFGAKDLARKPLSYLMLYRWGFFLLPLLPPPVAAQSVAPQQAPAVQSPGENELTLDQAIDLALAHNGDLGVARLDVQHFEALKAKAHAQYLPKLTNKSEATYLTEREGVILPSGVLGAPHATVPIPPKTLRIDQG